jgi:hypothetical protein
MADTRKPPAPEPELIPLFQAKPILGGLSERAIWQLCRDKKIPHLRIGKRIFFRREALAKWCADLEEATMTCDFAP